MTNTWKSLGAGMAVVLLCAVSCKRDGAKTVAVSPASAAAVKAQVDVLRDSVDVNWRRMTESDDQKIAITRLLLRELKPLPGYDAAQITALTLANNRLKARRYDQATMASSARIDQYDNAQDSLLQVLLPVAAPNGGAPSENARNFVEGIQQLDAGVVGFRVQYDRAAQQYNQYLKLHRAELQTLGGKYAQAQPLPLFTIGAE